MDNKCIVFTNDQLSNEDYHADVDHISGTSLWEMFSTCLAKWRYNDKESKGKSRALVFGTAAHANHLEPELFASEYFRMPERDDFLDGDGKPRGEIITSMAAAKAWLKDKGVAGYSKMGETELIEAVKNAADQLNITDVIFWHSILADAEKERGDREAISGRDYDMIQRMREVLFNNESFKRFFVGGASEISIFGELMGVKTKVRLDWVSPDADLCDYKTTDSCEPVKFGRKCFDLGYPMKMAMQREMFKKAYGRYPRTVSLMAQEKVEPFVVEEFTLSQHTLMIGAAQLREALAMYKFAKENDLWTSYGGGEPIIMDPPFYIEQKYSHLWADEKNSK